MESSPDGGEERKGGASSGCTGFRRNARIFSSSSSHSSVIMVPDGRSTVSDAQLATVALIDSSVS